MERIEIRNVNGKQLAYYNGIELPFMIKSVVTQDENLYAVAELTFLVDIESNKFSFEIKQEDLNNVLTKTINRNNSF